MLNSQTYVKEAGVLRSGEVMNSSVSIETLKDPETKVYRHSAIGARFFMPDGASLIFEGGVFITANKDIKFELDKVANKPGTQITTDEKALARLQAEVARAAADAERPASEGNLVGDQTLEVAGNAANLVSPSKTVPLI